MTSFGGHVSSMVSDAVELCAPYNKKKPLYDQEVSEIEHQALQKVGAIDPILRHILDVKVVQNQRRNFINLTVKRDYVTMLNHYRYGETYFCFFLSDKLEPFVIITAVQPTAPLGRAKLRTLSGSQVDNLCDAIACFKSQHGISGESYHYTGLDERDETEAFASSGAISRAHKAHSGHFHLKMRIATAMMTKLLPICSMFDFNALRARAEPIKYQCERQTMTWEETLRAIRGEIAPFPPGAPAPRH